MSSKFELKLLRASVSAASLPRLTDVGVIGEPIFVRKSFEDTINDIKVQYSKRNTIPIPITLYVVAVGIGLWCTYVVISDGTVWAWGAYDWLGCCDNWGCGDSDDPVLINMSDMYYRDTDPEYLYPYQLDGEVPNKIVYVKPSDNGLMTYFVDSAGQAWALGDCYYGTCGDGGDDYYECIFPAGGESLGEKQYLKVEPLDQGGGIAIDTSGLLWTWGYERWGQIGNGNSGLGSYGYVTTPFNPTQGGRTGAIDISGKTWIDCAGGWYGAAAIDSDGHLWCWGFNNYGQCGQGIPYSYPDDAYWTYPTQVGTDTDWVSVQGGEYGWCAQKTDGTLWFWGWNEGAYGDGTTVSSYVPKLGAGGYSWDSLWKYAYYWCLANKDGETYVWGLEVCCGVEGAGNLGLGVPHDFEQLTPTPFPHNFIMFDIMSWGGVGVDSDGDVYQWGDDLEVTGEPFDPPVQINFNFTTGEAI